jgi:uncharacterized protein
MLTVIEARVIGCLLEKERTVPDQYPLTLNALVTACNQATSREPVMRLDDADVELAIASLKAAGWLRIVHPSHGRSVTRYRQVADEKLGIEPSQSALLAVLLLRGPQTSAELRSRSERQHSYDSVTAVDGELQAMADAGLIVRLERHPGQKEQRWRQLIADEAEFVAPSAGTISGTISGSTADRLAHLEARVARLEAALGDLLGDEPGDLVGDEPGEVDAASGDGAHDPDAGV